MKMANDEASEVMLITTQLWLVFLAPVVPIIILLAVYALWAWIAASAIMICVCCSCLLMQQFIHKKSPKHKDPRKKLARIVSPVARPDAEILSCTAWIKGGIPTRYYQGHQDTEILEEMPMQLQVDFEKAWATDPILKWRAPLAKGKLTITRRRNKLYAQLVADNDTLGKKWPSARWLEAFQRIQQIDDNDQLIHEIAYATKDLTIENLKVSNADALRQLIADSKPPPRPEDQAESSSPIVTTGKPAETDWGG